MCSDPCFTPEVTALPLAEIEAEILEELSPAPEIRERSGFRHQPSKAELGCQALLRGREARVELARAVVKARQEESGIVLTPLGGEQVLQRLVEIHEVDLVRCR